MEIIQNIIKEGRINRPKAGNSCRFITVHDTANTDRGADAKAHANYVGTVNKRLSWHYSVDDHSIYQHLPDNEKSYHTSSAEANENAIAIELCVNSDGDFEKTVTNAVWLVKTLMNRHGIPPQNIMTHKDWTGKTCPHTLLSDGWKEFLARCSAEDTAPEKFISVQELRDMGYSGIAI